MLNDPAPYLVALQEQLTRHYPSWGVRALAIAGAGLSFLVCRAETDTFGPVALRVPWVRLLVNDTDGTLDARRLLEQEAVLTVHVGRHGVAVPAIYALHLGADGYDFLASEFMIGDESAPDSRSFGRLMRAIHTLPVPELALIEAGTVPFYERIATRLSERAAAVTRLTGVALPLPGRESLIAALAPRAGQRALLHMDARPANLFTQDGAIIAIADWGNALFGDPALELARIAESGHFSDRFIAGYGEDLLSTIVPRIATIYRLDTVVTLAIVFINEAPDPEAARVMLARAQTLAAEL